MKMKKGNVWGIAALLLCLPILFGVGAYGEEIDTPEPEKVEEKAQAPKQSKAADEVEKKELVVPINISPGSITAVEGETGKLSVDKFEGIELKGTFKEIKNNPNVAVSKDGTWTAKKIGATTFVPIFELSTETLKEIEKKHPETELQFKDIAQVINVKVGPKSIQVPIDISPNSITAVKGTTGKLTVEKFEGINLSGTFKEIKDNPTIELNSDGTWRAKQPGTATFTPEFELSAAALKEIEKKYPGTELQFKDMAQVINVQVNPEVIQVPIIFEPASITAMDGESGELRVKDFEGIKLRGSFEEMISDNPFVSLETNGMWTAMRRGSTVLIPKFEVYAETLEELQNKYPGSKIEFIDTEQRIEMEIKPTSLWITIDFSPKTITAVEGESGQLTAGDFDGIKLRGTFKEIKDNSVVEVTADGKWLAKQPGTVTFMPEFELSAETIKEIGNKYPGAKLIVEYEGQAINMTVNARNTVTPTTGTGGIKTPPTQAKQAPKSSKNLPKTGDTGRNHMVSAAGFAVVVVSIISFCIVVKKRKNN